jgi:hypothetical protein
MLKKNAEVTYKNHDPQVERAKKALSLWIDDMTPEGGNNRNVKLCQELSVVNEKTGQPVKLTELADSMQLPPYLILNQKTMPKIQLHMGLIINLVSN